MTPLEEYYQLMVMLFKSRRPDALGESEDAILDRMDVVWYRMNTEERRTADALSGRLASGELSEEQFIDMYDSQGEARFSPVFEMFLPMGEGLTSRGITVPYPKILVGFIDFSSVGGQASVRVSIRVRAVTVSNPPSDAGAITSFPENISILGDVQNNRPLFVRRSTPRVTKTAEGSETVTLQSKLVSV